MTNITLESLCGIHTLSAVEYGHSDDGQSELFYFTLDGITYCAEEDPDDGYRSAMGSLTISNKQLSTNVPPTKVLCKMSEEKYVDSLLMIDILTQKIVLEVGTDYTEDYYPVFVAAWKPKNLHCNISKEE